jgi:hypothetical protein
MGRRVWLVETDQTPRAQAAGGAVSERPRRTPRASVHGAAAALGWIVAATSVAVMVGGVVGDVRAAGRGRYRAEPVRC